MVKVKADLHNHFRTSSRHFESDLASAVDICSERLGKDCIVGLVNYSDKRYEHFVNLSGYERVFLGSNKNAVYFPEKRVCIVKGQEIPIQEKGERYEVLALGVGYDEHVRERMSLEDSLKAIRDSGAIAIAQHPFHFSGLGYYLSTNSDKLNLFDAIEIHNGEASLPFPSKYIGANRKAREFYEKVKSQFPHLGALSSSDGHSFFEIGTSWTEIDAPDFKNPKNFVMNLLSAIQDTNLKTPRRNHNSYFGAMNHIASLAYILGSQKIGLGKRFETDRPE